MNKKLILKNHNCWWIVVSIRSLFFIIVKNNNFEFIFEKFLKVSRLLNFDLFVRYEVIWFLLGTVNKVELQLQVVKTLKCEWGCFVGSVWILSGWKVEKDKEISEWTTSANFDESVKISFYNKSKYTTLVTLCFLFSGPIVYSKSHFFFKYKISLY